MGSEKLDLKKKENIINKVPKSLNDSNLEEDLGEEKHYSNGVNKGNNGDKIQNNGDIKNDDKNTNKNNKESKDCYIF